MKKLLALVLCVMMFVAVIPTAAFATQPAPTPATPTDAWPSLYASNKAISNAKKNIEYLYNGLAADNAVFDGIKAMDSFVVDLAKGLFADVDDYTYYTKEWNGKEFVDKKYTVSNDTLVKNTKAELRSIIGDSISDYMNDHIASFAEISVHPVVDGTYGLMAIGLNRGGATIYAGEDGAIYAQRENGTWLVADDAELYEKLITDADTKEALEELGVKNAKQFAKLDPRVRATFCTDGWATEAYGFSKTQDVELVKAYQYDPIKYANNFATAMSKALTSEKGAKGIEAYVYGLMQAKVQKDINDKMDDLVDAIVEWEDGSALLAAYGWNEGSWNPYAFINPNSLPKTSMDLSDIVAPNDTSFSWHWDGLEWIAD